MAKNITLAVDEDVLQKVREIATKEKTTVNAMVREFLHSKAKVADDSEEARARLLSLMENSKGDLGPDFKWDRDELYDDRMFPRHQRSDLRGDGKK